MTMPASGAAGTDATTNRPGGHAAPDGRTPARRLTTETKAFFKTTEFFAYVVAVIGVLIASQVIGTEDGHNDYFRGDKAWFYIVLLTIGYLVSRGLAKSGSRDPYTDR
ncbi:hypothetical protein [Actinomadura fibrosa]|uniref:Uncharacterized protein n=1 Tax=Actinomadura fibrosa TaxID=111802 RepID=A0ABW2XNF6_9ACTN|nr:hypothetical protein [Actinomadura fibrosa]